MSSIGPTYGRAVAGVVSVLFTSDRRVFFEQDDNSIRVALVIMAYNSDLLGVRWGVGMATAVLLGYIVSRGIAKAGSDEVVQRDHDDF